MGRVAVDGLPWSRPVRARGLKLQSGPIRRKLRLVAPRAGAWIETSMTCSRTTANRVAPRAGAWIETPVHLFVADVAACRAPCGRVD